MITPRVFLDLYAYPPFYEALQGRFCNSWDTPSIYDQIALVPSLIVLTAPGDPNMVRRVHWPTLQAFTEEYLNTLPPIERLLWL